MEDWLIELFLLSDLIVYLQPCMSLNNEKNCREISEHKVAVCEKTKGLRNENSSDLNSACLNVLVRFRKNISDLRNA